jgi:hypothetical protein
MAVVKDEKPLWRTGLALSGPVIVVGVCALAAGLVNPALLRSATLRGMDLVMMALSVLALAMLLCGLRPHSRRLRRWDVRLSILGNVILLALLAISFFAVQPTEILQPDVSAPQSVAGGGAGGSQ